MTLTPFASVVNLLDSVPGMDARGKIYAYSRQGFSHRFRIKDDSSCRDGIYSAPSGQNKFWDSIPMVETIGFIT